MVTVQPGLPLMAGLLQKIQENVEIILTEFYEI